MNCVTAPNAIRYCTPGGLDVTKLQPAIGAVVAGIDLAGEITAAAAHDIRNALLAHGVIFFCDQRLTYESHLAFARIFGEPMTEVPKSPRPEVLEVRARAGSREGTASAWHSDGCYMPVPPALSILRSIVVPPLGGDTCFSSAVAAYNGLSEEMKQCIAALRYTSSGAYLFSRGSNKFFDKEESERRKSEFPDVAHPVVRIHPETGARAIYCNEAQSLGIAGMDNDVGRALLKFLADQMRRPEYQCRWQWKPNEVVVWDNRAVQHYGVPDQTADRHMERIMVAGTRPLSIAEFESRSA